MSECILARDQDCNYKQYKSKGESDMGYIVCAVVCYVLGAVSVIAWAYTASGKEEDDESV